jgi:hypothetical protein
MIKNGEAEGGSEVLESQSVSQAESKPTGRRSKVVKLDIKGEGEKKPKRDKTCC